MIQNLGSTPEQRRENAVKAGQASGAARRKRKAMRETIGALMTTPIPDEQISALLEAAGFENSYENGVALAALSRAVHGDIEAARFVRDTLGEKPTESYQMSVVDKPVKSLDLSQLSDEELEAMVAKRIDALTDCGND